MATLDDVRILLGDIPKWDRQTATGDGATTRYQVSPGALPIITDSEEITVSGTAQAKPANYSINADLGLIIFVTAPANGAPIVAQFAYAELSDESITAILALESNVYLAAALGAQSLAGRYASLADKKVGDLSISYSQKSKAWAELAKTLRSSSSSGTGSVFAPYAGGLSRSEKSGDRSDTDLVQPSFTRTFAQPETWNADF